MSEKLVMVSMSFNLLWVNPTWDEDMYYSKADEIFKEFPGVNFRLKHLLISKPYENIFTAVPYSTYIDLLNSKYFKIEEDVVDLVELLLHEVYHKAKEELKQEMDNKEYNRKRDLIASSEASPEVKAEAMARLTEQYVGIKMKALALINECAADPIKAD